MSQRSILRPAIFNAVERERGHQDSKYGPHNDRNLSVGDFILIMQTELDEAKREFARNGRNCALSEVLQVVAVGVACMEQHGIVER